MRVAHVMTSGRSLGFLSGQAKVLERYGISLAFAAGDHPSIAGFEEREGVKVARVPLARRIAPWSDVRALHDVVDWLRQVRPDLVHLHTPKAGLIGTAAARLLGIPAVYSLHGLPIETATGGKRAALALSERAASFMATAVHAVSESVRARAIELGLVSSRKAFVLGAGSINGVDTSRFSPASPQQRLEARRRWGISENQPLVGFVGRITRDKGIVELADAWTAVCRTYPHARLLVAGEEDRTDPVAPDILQRLREDPSTILAGRVSSPEHVYHAIDVLVLPTYREGFPTVVLEASACSVPVVATTATGCIDAVVDGETGLLVPVQDAPKLADALLRYLADPRLRAAHGEAGRERILREYSRAHVTELWGEYYTTRARQLTG